MQKKRNTLPVFLAGFAGAVFFLWMKVTLYDKLEYEHDVFSVLQLSRDFLRGKPLLYENAYGYDGRLHNYYLVPFYSVFTVFFGGKGLFVAGFAAMVWALVLAARIFPRLPVWKGLLFVLFFFSPAAFYLWDNYRFGWHPETLFYPLSVVFVSAHVLRYRTSAWISGACILLTREDGVLLLWSLYMLYLAAAYPGPLRQTIKKRGMYTSAAAGVFMAGMAWLYFMSGMQSRTGETARRFLQAYSRPVLLQYLGACFGYWALWCLPVLLAAWLSARRFSFIAWSLAGLLPLLAVNLYSGAYYFPDPTYGINWAPRLAGTYGYITAALWLSLVYGRQTGRGNAYGPLFLLAGVLVCYLQYDGLKRLPYYYRYSVPDRIHLALFRHSPVEKDLQTLERLRRLAERIPSGYPVRMDRHLFALFDRTDYIWPERGRNPWRTPRLVITARDTENAEPMPHAFEPLGRIGRYEIWADPENKDIRKFLED